MEEEKRETLEDERGISDDMKELKSDIKTIRLELAEIRAAFFNLANEMKLMHKGHQRDHQETISGIIACRQAFYKCKIGYERVAEAYENIEDGIDSATGIISGTY